MRGEDQSLCIEELKRQVHLLCRSLLALVVYTGFRAPFCGLRHRPKILSAMENLLLRRGPPAPALLPGRGLARCTEIHNCLLYCSANQKKLRLGSCSFSADIPEPPKLQGSTLRRRAPSFRPIGADVQCWQRRQRAEEARTS